MIILSVLGCLHTSGASLDLFAALFRCFPPLISAEQFKKEFIASSLKIFNYLRKTNPVSLDLLFDVVPPSAHNPLMFPTLLFYAFQNKDFSTTKLTICPKEFIEISGRQCMKETSIPIFHLSLLLAKHSTDRCTAASWLVRNGLDPNELGIILSSGIPSAEFKYTEFPQLKKLKDMQVSPLGVACALDDLELVRTLLAIGSDPSLACLTFTSSGAAAF